VIVGEVIVPRAGSGSKHVEGKEVRVTLMSSLDV
jgi:hypothetical protein